MPLRTMILILTLGLSSFIAFVPQADACGSSGCAPAPSCERLHWTTGWAQQGMYPYSVPAHCWLVVDASGINHGPGGAIQAFKGPLGPNTVHLKEGAGVQGSDGPLTACQRLGNLTARGIPPAYNFLPHGWPRNVHDCQASGRQTIFAP